MWFIIIAAILIYVVFRYSRIFSSSSKSIENQGGEYETIDTIYNYQKVQKQKEIDYLLDKINKKGIEGLTDQEKERLDELTGN